MPNPIVTQVSTSDAFRIIDDARINRRRIIPLFGSGISVTAGIPTSAMLCDYIVAVCETAKSRGWNDYRGYLRKWGWPHRHDVWSDWMAPHDGAGYQMITQTFQKHRNKLYAESAQQEIRPFAPLYARLAKTHFNELRTASNEVTDYRSLLARAIVKSSG